MFEHLCSQYLCIIRVFQDVKAIHAMGSYTLSYHYKCLLSNSTLKTSWVVLLREYSVTSSKIPNFHVSERRPVLNFVSVQQPLIMFIYSFFFVWCSTWDYMYFWGILSLWDWSAWEGQETWEVAGGKNIQWSVISTTDWAMSIYNVVCQRAQRSLLSSTGFSLAYILWRFLKSLWIFYWFYILQKMNFLHSFRCQGK